MTEFLIFNAGSCELALPVSDVREVVRAATLSTPAAALPAVAGLLNLRGQVVPVVNLLQVAGVAQPPLSDTDFLIILGGNDIQTFALRAIGEVQLTADAQPVEQDNGKGQESGPVAGLIRVGSRIVSILNPHAVSVAPIGSTEALTQGGFET